MSKPVQIQVEQLRKQFLLCNPEDKPSKRRILSEIECLTDTRTFCIVLDKNNSFVRHVFQVVPDAESRLEDLKQEYYGIYAELPEDAFFFCKGMRGVQEFTRKLEKEQEEIEK